jgi:hypothetical protein
MTTENKTTVERVSDGVAGPSREVSQKDQTKSGAENAGLENYTELMWARRNVKDDLAPEPETEQVNQPAREVFRKTELHTTPQDTGSDDMKTLMRLMMRRLRSPDPEILYLKYENSYRDFICSLMARQYREEKEQREQVAVLWKQIEFLDERLERSIDRLERLIHETTPHGRF